MTCDVLIHPPCLLYFCSSVKRRCHWLKRTKSRRWSLYFEVKIVVYQLGFPPSQEPSHRPSLLPLLRLLSRHLLRRHQQLHQQLTLHLLPLQSRRRRCHHIQLLLRNLSLAHRLKSPRINPILSLGSPKKPASAQGLA